MTWSEERLRRLFEHYNRKYWHGRIQFQIVIGTCEAAMGWCELKNRLITIDVERHQTDREVRSTLLHEMAHAASPKSRGHDVKFFAQLEKLLSRGAPIGVGKPEAGSVRIMADIVPARFPLLKRRIERAETRRQKAVEDYGLAKNVPAIEITDAAIVREFEDAASFFAWKEAVTNVGRRNGLVDETGRAVSRWAAGLLKQGKVVHTRGRREYLLDCRLRTVFGGHCGEEFDDRVKK